MTEKEVLDSMENASKEVHEITANNAAQQEEQPAEAASEVSASTEPLAEAEAQTDVTDAANAAPAADAAAAQPAEAAVSTEKPAAKSKLGLRTKTKEKEESAAAAEPAREYLPVFDYMTGKNIDNSVKPRVRESYVSANRAVDNLLKLYSFNSNPSDSDIEAALGDDIWAFNRVYVPESQRYGANASVFFGSGMVGRVPRATKDAILAIVQADRKRKAEAEQEAVNKRNEEFRVGDYVVTKPVADDINKYIDMYNNSDSIEIKKESIALLYNALKRAGYPVPDIAPEDMPTTIDGLLLSPESRGDELILEQLIQGANKFRAPEKVEGKDLEEKWRRRQLEAEIAARGDVRAAQRARVRTGVADLAALVGDVIRASQGAYVGERDWKDIYNNLDKQGKAAIDNYRVRMAHLQEQADAEAEKLRAAAAAAELKDKELAAKAEIARQQEAGKNKRWQDKLDNDKDIAEIRAGVARDKNNTPGKTTSYDTKPFRLKGKNYYFRSGRYNAIAKNIYAVLKKNGVNFGIKDMVRGLDRSEEISTSVAMFLASGTFSSQDSYGVTHTSNWDDLPSDAKKEIISILSESEYTEDENENENEIPGWGTVEETNEYDD